MSYKNTTYPHIIPDLTQWPIYKLSHDKKAFLEEVRQLTVSKILNSYPSEKALNELLGKVLYSERIRLSHKAWKADAPDEKSFWSRIKQELLAVNPAELSETDIPEDSSLMLILNQILNRYNYEIVGNFEPKMYGFAEKFLPMLFSKLLSSSLSKSSLRGNKYTLDEKFKITGNIELIRKLALEGTVVVVPTHFSNIDSITIGYAIHRIGIPAMTYGAGLNLFSIGLLSFFMNNLGAYKVDRRKKNVLYLETLKNYSEVLLERGTHQLFFPGGTRSRSGEIENSLKLGLLGTAIEAQRNLILRADENGSYKKIYILPVNLNYHFVLEAPALINDYLKATGKDQFISENDEYSSSYKMVKFIAKFLFAKSDLTISFATPLDVLGNEVDEEGNSVNHLQKKIDLRDYFKVQEDLKVDIQRENEYTRMLEKAIVKKFHSFNTMLTSHFVAFVAFSMMRNMFKELNLYAFLRLPEEDTELDYDKFLSVCERVRSRLLELEKEGKIQLSNLMKAPIDEVVKHGIRNMGIYHTESVLHMIGQNKVSSENKKLLYYYHNRALGYNLENYV